MSSELKKITILIAIFLTSFSLQARDSEESFLMLREAVMESNGDYNKYKKKMNYEEFDRADNWNERSTQAIIIGAQKGQAQDLSDFKQLNDDIKSGEREVSSHSPSEN